jgi:hypothetical protein
MIHDDFSFNELFCWEDPGLSLRNTGLIKQLRTLEKSIQDKMADLEKEPVLNKESIMQERVTLEAAQKELRRLERKILDVELGQN